MGVGVGVMGQHIFEGKKKKKKGFSLFFPFLFFVLVFMLGLGCDDYKRK